ncbi:hypothetical protein EUGRSUZ_C00677 [Eucalyptus grandis]|uniref:Uncharacterized protein n=2 Tax=Eucalyptus grandis TaxID=71139 RepID=A0ACC3LBB8_EUCGR|nr:hypothetical protein EUGRSUZ_C00677 [Eucalyptus grandis]
MASISNETLKLHFDCTEFTAHLKILKVGFGQNQAFPNHVTSPLSPISKRTQLTPYGPFQLSKETQLPLASNS